jgi:hypothetical protein
MNQTEIRFRPGQNALGESAQHALDEMATPLKDRHGYVIEVQGWSPGRVVRILERTLSPGRAHRRKLDLRKSLVGSESQARSTWRFPVRPMRVLSSALCA